MTDPEGQKYVIEPFDPDRHDRTAFFCGIKQVDNFFKKTANKLARAGNLRVYVMTDHEGTVIGYIALNAHSIDYQDLPGKFKRTRPSHGSIPAAFIAMIGVDRRYAGHGFGGDLLVHALTRVVQAADEIGIAVAVLDVLDDGVPELVKRRQALYQRYGFRPLPSNPLRLFLPVETVRALLDDLSSVSAA